MVLEVLLKMRVGVVLWNMRDKGRAGWFWWG